MNHLKVGDIVTNSCYCIFHLPYTSSFIFISEIEMWF